MLGFLTGLYPVGFEGRIHYTIGFFIWANQVGTAAKNWERIIRGRSQNSWRFQLIEKRRRCARCSELACDDGGRMGSRRQYGPGIGM